MSVETSEGTIKVKVRNDEVQAAEEVINSLNYYFKYVLIRLKRHGEVIR